jgi:hypothetical protein
MKANFFNKTVAKRELKKAQQNGSAIYETKRATALGALWMFASLVC